MILKLKPGIRKEGIARVIARIEKLRFKPHISKGAERVLIGVIGTVAYDVSKAILSQLDPSPFDPFAAIRVFGRLLLGEGVSSEAIVAAGTAYHLLNGISFAVAYTFLFGERARRSLGWALLTGAGWGLFLEAFQLTLYPGWLDMTFYQEFATISAISHIVYGISLGLLCRRLLGPLPGGASDPARAPTAR